MTAIGLGTMNEKLKVRLEKLEAQTKKQGLAILGVVGTIVASAAAVYYRNELVKSETIDPDAWPIIEIPPKLMVAVEDGETLRYRQYERDGRTFVQVTTFPEGFTGEANERFENRIPVEKYTEHYQD